MLTEILLPQLGMFMLEATIVRWIAPDGATVKRGDPLLEFQTDKVIQALEAFMDGVLQRVAAEGETVPVKGLLGYLLAEGQARVASGAEVKRLASEPSASSGTPDIQKPKPTGRVRASPIARRLAKEHGLDLATIVGSGPGGRVGENDVLAAIEAMQAAPSVEEHPDGHEAVLDSISLVTAGPERAIAQEELGPSLDIMARSAQVETPLEVERLPLSGIRQIIFDRMGHSSRTVARVTEFAEVDATELVEVRNCLKAQLQRAKNLSVSYNDLFIMIVAKALREHRLLNSTFANGEINLLPQINIGLAVDTERGLLVPVVRDADSRGLLDVVREVRALIERVQMGRSLPEDLTGGTFTITNLGMYEIDGFTPIVNLPECAILGVGRIQAKPVVYQGEVRIRQMMVLSLSFDHRIVDGAPAARFLWRVKQLIEAPHLLVM